MTLDVTIGKRISETEIEQCPESKENVCDPERTRWPTEPYRSGNNVAMWRFFTKHQALNEIYKKMRKHPDTNDKEIALLEPFIAQINQIKESDFAEDIDKDRLKWLKFWSNKAIELFGNQAAIMFS